MKRISMGARGRHCVSDHRERGFSNGVVTPTAMQRATLPPREGPRRAAGGQVVTANRQKRRNAHIIYKDQTERGNVYMDVRPCTRSPSRFDFYR